MLTLGTHFQQLLTNIQPPAHRIDAAQELPPVVRHYLKERAEFRTVEPHSRLVGSYAQNMCVGDVKDVDFLVSVPGDPKENEPEAKVLIRQLKKAVEGLPEALGWRGYANIDVEQARRSVHVYFEDRDFHIDAVPCIAPDAIDDVIFVPDKGWNRWIPTQPVGFINLLNELNKEHGEKVKPLGRLMKHFRNYQMKTRRPKSYWLMALLVHHIREDSLDMTLPLAALFRDLLDSIHKQYAPLLGRDDGATPNIADPMLGHNISWNWDRSHFETFMRRVDDGRRLSSQALECGTDERDKAIALWQQIFGDEYFPADVTEAAAALAAAAYPGAASVTATGRIISETSAAQARPTLVRRTTYHGSGQHS